MLVINLTRNPANLSSILSSVKLKLKKSYFGLSETSFLTQTHKFVLFTWFDNLPEHQRTETLIKAMVLDGIDISGFVSKKKFS